MFTENGAMLRPWSLKQRGKEKEKLIDREERATAR